MFCSSVSQNINKPQRGRKQYWYPTVESILFIIKFPWQLDSYSIFSLIVFIMLMCCYRNRHGIFPSFLINSYLFFGLLDSSVLIWSFARVHSLWLIIFFSQAAETEISVKLTVLLYLDHLPNISPLNLYRMFKKIMHILIQTWCLFISP